jgi:phage repressor protein C with HTH and peptisase S24 domain
MGYIPLCLYAAAWNLPQMATRLIREIERRMKALGLTPISTAKKAELGRDAVRDILRGKSDSPSHETLVKIARALGCTIADLTGERVINMSGAATTNVAVHELDVHAAAGLGADAQGDIMASDEASAVVATFTFPSTGFREAFGAHPHGVKMIAVRGDSMIPALWPGQRCMVDTNDRTPSPPGVFVVWDGMGLVLKRVELVPGSDPPRVRLSSDNVRYQTYERTIDEAFINGRVVGVWARL